MVKENEIADLKEQIKGLQEVSGGKATIETSNNKFEKSMIENDEIVDNHEYQE